MSDAGLRGTSVIVTGAAGFIGYHTCKRLVSAGARVAGLDSLTEYYDVGLKRARLAQLGTEALFSFRQIDVAEPDVAKAIFGEVRPDAVIHLAAQAGVRHSLVEPMSYARANIDGFLCVLEAARAHPVGHLIYASSSSVYGSGSRVPFHEDDPAVAPESLYAATKRADELMAEAYARLFGMPLSGLRFFTVYGPWGRPDMAYFSFTKAILEGRPIDVYNHGKLRRDFTYVDDVTEAIARLVAVSPRAGAGSNRPPHVLYNVGNHTPVALGRFIEAIEAAVGKVAVKRFLPMQPGDVLETFADVRRLQEATGFSPRTPLAEGIQQFVDWYRSYHGC